MCGLKESTVGKHTTPARRETSFSFSFYNREEIKVTSEQETEMEPEEPCEIGSDDVTSKEEAGCGDDFSGINDGRITIFG